MNTEDLWYKNAVIYAVDVRRFRDGNGDGWGDFVGLTEKLEYLSELGVTCLWVLPFFPTPFRDNGYDVTHYYGIDPRVGTMEDFLDFLHRAGEFSLRVIVDLVVDQTSDQHPWFVAARHDAASRYRNYYAWVDNPPPVPPDKGTIFPGEEDTVWTYDDVAGAYYYHRFYHFEPDLNVSNPEVRDEIKRVVDFWLSLGVSGFRVDAASHMIEGHGTPASRPSDPHGILKDIRGYVSGRKDDAMLVGEVDEPPEKLASYFGDNDELNMLFNFVMNNYTWLALARQRAEPIVRALKQLPSPPVTGQWLNFLRNLDELDLERLTEADRYEVLETFAPEERMRIYGRGTRRRLAPMLGGDRRRIEMAFSLLCTLPGAPVFMYGDEIGMGEDLAQAGRNAVRSPMQWSDDKNAGFSSASHDQLVQPVIEEGTFGYPKINVEAQQRDPDSLLHWVSQLIHARRSCPEFGRGNWHMLDVEDPGVLAHQSTWKDGIVLAIHNLSERETTVTLDLRDQRGRELIDVLGSSMKHPLEQGMYEIQLSPFGYAWYRVTGERVED